MKYLKDAETGAVFAFDADGSQDAFIPEQLVAMTDAEVAVHLNPELPASAYSDAIQAHLDSAAEARGYDSISSAVTYADEPAVAKFQQDGIALRAWRSIVWAYAYEQLDAVASGSRTKPTISELIAELPTI